MCGFAGVIAWDEKYRTSAETLRRMSAAIAHRGPDGEGYYFNHYEGITPDRPQVALAFRRLAILDPDPRSNQPFTDGQHWLVFNGEIYNFRELRKELTQLDSTYEWRTTGDTEVLLRAYAVWGEKCVEHLNGMFAFAIWDGADKSLFLARDRMGQKPLYISYDGPNGIAFGSELSAIRAVPWVKYQLDDAVIEGYLRWGYVDNGISAYTGISQINPGQTLFYGARMGGRTYFRADRAGSDAIKPVGADAARSTRTLVERAVKRQLVSDVPLGCFLSGGIDSSIIAAAMKAAVPAEQPVLTFSIRFDDKRYDESNYAAGVARHLGTVHRTFDVKPEATEDLPKLAAAFGEPFADSSALPTHYLARETRKHVKVALSGDGGDELFGGYDRYRAMRYASAECFTRVPALRELISQVAACLPGSHPKSRTARFKRFAASLPLTSPRRYASFLSIFDHPTLVALFGRDPNPGDPFGSYITFPFLHLDDVRDDVRRAMAIDRTSYLPEDLLRKVDRASMLHALEVRNPFMDHELVQFAAGLSTDQLLKGGPKRMLREAFADDLPDFVFKRKKMGFAVPIGEWFRGELRAMLRDHLFAAHSFARGHFNMPVVERLIDEHEQQRVDHSQRLYALLMLELWWKIQIEAADGRG